MPRLKRKCDIEGGLQGSYLGLVPDFLLHSRKRGETCQDVTGTGSSLSLDKLASYDDGGGSRVKRCSNMAIRYQPKSYGGRARNVQGYQRKQPGVTHRQEGLSDQFEVHHMATTPTVSSKQLG
jgi:hypothetical protein